MNLPEPTSFEYDYIIAGAGLSGLSLAWYLSLGDLKEKKILILDTSLQPAYDKVWSFWTKTRPPFEDLIHKNWPKAYTCVSDHAKIEALKPYTYHSLLSRDFSIGVLEKLKENNHFEFLEARIQKIWPQKKKAFLETENGKRFSASYIFQSCFRPPDLDKSLIRYPLIQHFLGWEIEMDTPVFDPETITFMDFDEDFDEAPAFMYVLPWSPFKALVEFTVFSRTPFKKEVYRRKIKEYLRNKCNASDKNYTIEREETGQIPMQDAPYVPWYAKRVMNIGTMAGMPKPSTGYAFMRIQKHAFGLAKSILEGKKPMLPLRSKYRYRAYDLLLLCILDEDTALSRKIFKKLFENNPLPLVFKFLDEETHPVQDINIMSGVPWRPFLRSLWKNKKYLLSDSFRL